MIDGTRLAWQVWIKGACRYEVVLASLLPPHTAPIERAGEYDSLKDARRMARKLQKGRKRHQVVQ